MAHCFSLCRKYIYWSNAPSKNSRLIIYLQRQYFFFLAIRWLRTTDLSQNVIFNEWENRHYLAQIICMPKKKNLILNFLISRKNSSGVNTIKLKNGKIKEKLTFLKKARLFHNNNNKNKNTYIYNKRTSLSL